MKYLLLLALCAPALDFAACWPVAKMRGASEQTYSEETLCLMDTKATVATFLIGHVDPAPLVVRSACVPVKG